MPEQTKILSKSWEELLENETKRLGEAVGKSLYVFIYLIWKCLQNEEFRKQRENIGGWKIEVDKILLSFANIWRKLEGGERRIFRALPFEKRNGLHGPGLCLPQKDNNMTPIFLPDILIFINELLPEEKRFIETFEDSKGYNAFMPKIGKYDIDNWMKNGWIEALEIKYIDNIANVLCHMSPNENIALAIHTSAEDTYNAIDFQFNRWQKEYNKALKAYEIYKDSSNSNDINTKAREINQAILKAREYAREAVKKSGTNRKHYGNARTKLSHKSKEENSSDANEIAKIFLKMCSKPEEIWDSPYIKLQMYPAVLIHYISFTTQLILSKLIINNNGTNMVESPKKVDENDLDYSLNASIEFLKGLIELGSKSTPSTFNYSDIPTNVLTDYYQLSVVLKAIKDGQSNHDLTYQYFKEIFDFAVKQHIKKIPKFSI